MHFFNLNLVFFYLFPIGAFSIQSEKLCLFRYVWNLVDCSSILQGLKTLMTTTKAKTSRVLCLPIFVAIFQNHGRRINQNSMNFRCQS